MISPHWKRESTEKKVCIEQYCIRVGCGRSNMYTMRSRGARVGGRATRGCGSHARLASSRLASPRRVGAWWYRRAVAQRYRLALNTMSRLMSSMPSVNLASNSVCSAGADITPPAERPHSAQVAGAEGTRVRTGGAAYAAYTL